MTPLGPLAVFSVALLALFTGSLAADRPRHRSGPIRSVPVGADIKRDTNFDCPEEFGYYPHPNDCTLYYVCVFGGALLESCTGGLMYSHELQTCDWPRNVGCDATNAGAERAVDLEREIDVARLNDRDVPPPRRAPPQPPRAQPNPVVTSRGQPKYTREEYIKQQQLYEEVDDLPPAEEVESDRQQRVYRGQPSTIGQVQRDRDGYSQINSGRTLNSNIIPQSAAQGNGKIGSFSFGTQVDDRRATPITQAPQTYSVKSDVTDFQTDLNIDILINEIFDHDKSLKVSRKKRNVVDNTPEENVTNTESKNILARSDIDEDAFVSSDDLNDNDENIDDTERGKRQIRNGRYFINNGLKNVGGKNWGNPKPVKLFDHSHFTIVPNLQNNRKPTYNTLSFQEDGHKQSLPDNVFTTSNPYLSYTTSTNLLSYNTDQRPFKASLPDPFNLRPPHNPINTATHIITKSPPISSLTKNENPFSALAGGFFNNVPLQSNSNQYNQFRNQPKFQNHQDSSQLPSAPVTNKPIAITTPLRTQEHSDKLQHMIPIQQSNSRPNPYTNVNNNDSEEESDESSENDNDENDFHQNQYNFPKPPYEFRHPSKKYADITNPFADPNFDFDDFLAKLRGDHKSTTRQPTLNLNKQTAINNIVAFTTRPSNSQSTPFKTTTLTYKGMSTPKPFTLATNSVQVQQWSSNLANNPKNVVHNITKYQNIKTSNSQNTQHPPIQQGNYKQLNQQIIKVFENAPQLSTVKQLKKEGSRLKLQPPNFQDDRQLPLNHNFNVNVEEQHKQRLVNKVPTNSNLIISTVSPKTYLIVTGKNEPFSFTTPKPHFINSQKHVTLQGNGVVTGRPYLISSIKPQGGNVILKHSTFKPISNNQQHSSKLQQYRFQPNSPSTLKPHNVSEIPSLESIFSQVFRPTTTVQSDSVSTVKPTSQTNTMHDVYTTSPKPKRRPIPKPSPEMSDYYYDDDDEQYYYEPAVKPKYMPSSEVRPQRPPIAQNYEEYEDDESYEDDDDVRQSQGAVKRPPGYNAYHVESVTKNHNDVSVVTKSPFKTLIKNNFKGKIPVPVMMNIATPATTVLMRPEVSNYQIMHSHRNRTIHLRRPLKIPLQNGPHTIRPPKYLNQTTLRPYTVRHRLANPTTTKMLTNTNDQNKQVRGRVRHPSTMTQFKSTTPSDNHNQETRYTKTKHDDRTNSLEPTESVVPVSYQSPRPKMLYNGSQIYNPDQFDPYYIYDEDGELYKDSDYVQQFNSASLRPAVQQTYRGTPPPARRPVETYTARPVSVDDYDQALIQGQINTQNQYQTAIRTSPRVEGNELGYDHNPSSVRTTLYEATSISTTPSTTTTSTSTTTTTTTTTQRPTTAPFTEAMTPSRYTQRSSTDESHSPLSPTNLLTISNSRDSDPPTKAFVNFSSLAKPFQKTNNSHRFQQTILNGDQDKKISSKLSDLKENVEIVSDNLNNKKKIVSLTTGFSIRRNIDNDNNPYTLTLISRPLDNFNASTKYSVNHKSAEKLNYELSNYSNENTNNNKKLKYPTRRTDSSREHSSSEKFTPTNFERQILNTVQKDRPVMLVKKVTTIPQSTVSPKYYLKVIKRPAPFSSNDDDFNASDNYKSSTENSIETDDLIERALQNVRQEDFTNNTPTDEIKVSNENPEMKWIQPPVSPYAALNNIRNKYTYNYNRLLETSTSPVTKATPTTSTSNYEVISINPDEGNIKAGIQNIQEFNEEKGRSNELFSDKAKQLLKVFFNNFVSNQHISQESEITTIPLPITEKTVNIGFHKKYLKYDDNKVSLKNNKRVEIITEESPTKFTLEPQTEEFITKEPNDNDLSVTSPKISYKWKSNASETPLRQKIENIHYDNNNDGIEDVDSSHKFKKILTLSSTTEKPLDHYSTYNIIDVEPTKLSNIDNITPNTVTKQNIDKINNDFTPTTKSILTKTLTSTKNYSPFPTRASRVNPAIKLAATNLGDGRRSYQSSSKCSSDDSLQANPKCNEIKYQRPTATRGRGHAHYSTQGGGESPPQSQSANRGTPPTRSRPTLKPSTAIVSKTTVAADIYINPPRRPSSVYPQPTPDKTAAKCRKDVCLLPDCYCGGKEIPGDLAVESVPQIVLLTFDDSVNDLNKGLYADLFEKGRVNPNGCPISATFYVSHEWTDYSQVQNLYAGGHEMASHTISHSFGEQFSQKKWNREVGGQREILAAYGGVKLEDVRGMRAPFLSVGGNKMFKMLYDSNFTYDSSLPVYENRPPSWPYTLDYKLFHDCMIPPCPTRSYPGVWEVPMVMWQDLNGGRCSMGDACSNPPEAEGVYKMLLKNFDRHYTTNRAPFGLFYHAAWFTQPHHKAGFIMFLDFINQMSDVWIVTNWQALQWVRDPTPISRMNSFQPFQCNYQDRPKKCNNPKVCNLWHKSGVRYMRTCQPCPEVYPWTGKTGIRSSRIDNDIED